MTYVNRDNLISFCEAKHLTPFPELIINFIGTVNELKPMCLSSSLSANEDDFIAPSLMMSGALNKPTQRIKEALEARYLINVLDDLFNNEAKKILEPFSADKISTLGHKKVV